MVDCQSQEHGRKSQRKMEEREEGREGGRGRGKNAINPDVFPSMAVKVTFPTDPNPTNTYGVHTILQGLLVKYQ